MAAIKKFFEKRKMNVKFKRAGEGHRLDEPGTSGGPSTQHRPMSGENYFTKINIARFIDDLV